MPLTQVDQGLLSSTAQYTGFKNRIINGAMVIDQRNAGASVTPTSGAFTLDRWAYLSTQASKVTIQQNAGSVTLPSGFSNYLGVTSSSAYSVLTGDTFLIDQRIEGFNFADMAWGTASAATITLSFWVRSSLTGTFGGALTNSATNRNYLFSYTISSANTWEQKSVTIAGDTSGTWIGAANGIGCIVRFGLGSGATFTGTANTWQAGNLVQPTSSVSVVGTNGATFYITGVQLEKGSTATSFDYRPYGTELALCQRYCVAFSSTGTSPIATGVAANASTGQICIPLPVTGRVAPTGIVSSAAWIFNNYGSGNGGTGAVTFTSATPLNITVNSSTTGGGSMTAGYGGQLYSSSGTSTFYTTGQEL